MQLPFRIPSGNGGYLNVPGVLDAKVMENIILITHEGMVTVYFYSKITLPVSLSSPYSNVPLIHFLIVVELDRAHSSRQFPQSEHEIIHFLAQ